MSEIELHGWDDLHLPTEALFNMTSRAFKLYGYLLFRGRGKKAAWPSIETMAGDLSSDAENWSAATTKRHLKELESAGYIVRQRRMSKTSITHIFKDANEGLRFASELMGDPAVSSPMSQLTAHIRADRSNTHKKENQKDSIPKTAKPTRNVYFEAVLEGTFGIVYKPDMKLPRDVAGRVNRTVKVLEEAGITLEDYREYIADYRKDNPALTPVQSHVKLPMAILAWKDASPKKQVVKVDNSHIKEALYNAHGQSL